MEDALNKLLDIYKKAHESAANDPNKRITIRVEPLLGDNIIVTVSEFENQEVLLGEKPQMISKAMHTERASFDEAYFSDVVAPRLLQSYLTFNEEKTERTYGPSEKTARTYFLESEKEHIVFKNIKEEIIVKIKNTVKGFIPNATLNASVSQLRDIAAGNIQGVNNDELIAKYVSDITQILDRIKSLGKDVSRVEAGLVQLTAKEGKTQEAVISETSPIKATVQEKQHVSKSHDQIANDYYSNQSVIRVLKSKFPNNYMHMEEYKVAISKVPELMRALDKSMSDKMNERKKAAAYSNRADTVKPQEKGQINQATVPEKPASKIDPNSAVPTDFLRQALEDFNAAEPKTQQTAPAPTTTPEPNQEILQAQPKESQPISSKPVGEPVLVFEDTSKTEQREEKPDDIQEIINQMPEEHGKAKYIVAALSSAHSLAKRGMDLTGLVQAMAIEYNSLIQEIKSNTIAVLKTGKVEINNNYDKIVLPEQVLSIMEDKSIQPLIDTFATTILRLNINNTIQAIKGKSEETQESVGRTEKYNEAFKTQSANLTQTVDSLASTMMVNAGNPVEEAYGK